MDGTWTTAKAVSPSFFRRRPRLRLLFDSMGKGRLRSTARGVRTGKSTFSKYSAMKSRWSGVSSSVPGRVIPCFFSWGSRERAKQLYCRSTKAWTASSRRRSWAEGVRPAGSGSLYPDRTCSCRPATRTMKNSSRLEAVIPRNLHRSRMGFSFSYASSSTRALKSSQLSSRLV